MRSEELGMRNLTENAVADKSLAFALRVIALYKYLCAEKNEYVLSKQVLRSGTSIGANIAEAQCAVSRKDFLSKLYIAFKECSETKYWLELLFRSDYIDAPQYNSIQSDCTELLKMLSALVVAVFLAVPYWKGKYFAKPAKRGGKNNA